MAQQTINNGETGLEVRNKINDNFDELYSSTTVNLPRVESKSKNFINDMELALSKYKLDSTKSNFLWIGDSVVAGAISDITLTYFNKFANAVDTRQHGSGSPKITMFASDYASTEITPGNFALEVGGTWLTDEGNAYSTPDETQTDLTTVSGWLKTVVTGSTFTINAVSSYKFKVLFACGDAFTGETSGSISIVIDGGAPEVIDLNAQSGDYFWKEFDAPVNDIVITANLDVSEYVAIQVVYLVATHDGLNLLNSAVPGSGAFHWKDRLNIIDAYAPALSFVSLGANDILKGQTVEQYDTNMRLILDKLATYGDIIYAFYACFDESYPTLTSTEFSRIETFRAKAKSLATEYNIAFIDFHDMFINGATMVENGYLVLPDGIHPIAIGHESMYQYMLHKIYVT